MQLQMHTQSYFESLDVSSPGATVAARSAQSLPCRSLSGYI